MKILVYRKQPARHLTVMMAVTAEVYVTKAAQRQLQKEGVAHVETWRAHVG